MGNRCPCSVPSAITVNDDLAPEPGTIDALVVTGLTDYVATSYSLLEKNEKEEIFGLPFTYTL